MMDLILKVTAPIKRRIMLAIARGVIQSVKDTTGLQQMKLDLLADETIDRLDRVQNYGFTSVPKVGAEAVVLFLGGNRDHGVIIAADDRATRLKSLSPGDAAMYTTSGAKAVLKDATQNFEIKLNKLKIENNSNELIDVLSDTLQFLIDARTMTLLGPQPLFDITGMQTLATLKTRLDTFKV